MRKVIHIVFFALFFGTPLVFFSKTSELFEFNKIIFLYTATIIIVSCWITDMIFKKKFVFRKTILDIPLVIFLSSQFISTLLSLDRYTSFFGYYSRWNGGLLSLVCFAILYWAFVSYVEAKEIKRLMLALIGSTAIASIWGALEHFGHSPSCLVITGKFDVNCWVQDVAFRVYATFGQPNWMAAWITAIIPFLWGSFFSEKKSDFTSKKNLIYLSLNILFFAALLFTKSRSGIIAFAISSGLFWLVLLFIQRKQDFNSIKKVFALCIFTVVVITAIVGTPWTKSLFELKNKTAPIVQETSAPALETGGTESGEIRKIVWTGALNVWKIYPVFGSGVETFAYSYYQGRPMAHNLTSEWNFLYNKAHNEYLNYLATTGLVGLISYVALISASLYIFAKPLLIKVKSKKALQYNELIILSLFSGYISILITNFFGFSVVPINLLFFLFPAIAVVVQFNKSENEVKVSNNQYILLGFICVIPLFLIARYWLADFYYSSAVKAKADGEYEQARLNINSSIAYFPKEAIYHNFLADLFSSAAVQLSEKDMSEAKKYMEASLSEMAISEKYSPDNVKLLKSDVNIYSDLAEIDNSNLFLARSVVTKLIEFAPTDPSPRYQLALIYAKLGLNKEAITADLIAIEMKPDYKIARRLLAFLYKETKENEKAKEQLNYILKNISPDDQSIVDELKTL